MPYLQFSNPLIPESLRFPVLTRETGQPRYWVTVWSILWMQDLAPSTAAKKLRHIEALYVHADNIGGPGFLDDVLGQCDMDELGNLLEAYFVSLRNRPVISGATEQQWQSGLSFVNDVASRVGKSSAKAGKMAEIERRLLRLKGLYGQLRIQKTRRSAMLRSLPAEVLEHLIDMLAPDFDRNPFTRLLTRWSVFLGFILMLRLGLRRGELLLMTVDAVKSGFDKRTQRTRYWINVEKNEAAAKLDTRYNKPRIKNRDSIRQIPISENTALLIQAYTENYRGRPNHPFLLNTQWNTPLSTESLTKYFNQLSSRLPKSLLKVLRDRNGFSTVDPHDLRHTCAVVRLNQLLSQGDQMDEALQKMRTFFGWSRTSDMPQKYARAVFEDRLSSAWSDAMDASAELLRSIPKGH